MKRNVSVVRFKFRCNILIIGKIIKEMLGSLASGTHSIISYGTTVIYAVCRCPKRRYAAHNYITVVNSEVVSELLNGKFGVFPPSVGV